MLIAGAVAGVPLFIVVVIAVVPLAVLAMKLGSKRILPTATNAANRRGEFLGTVVAQAALHTAPASQGLWRAGGVAYTKSEDSDLAASIRQANAYSYRSCLIQLLVLALNCSAVVFSISFGASNSLVEPAAVIYFAATLASGMQSTVETLQEVGVFGLAAERVRLLEDFKTEQVYPAVRVDARERLEEALASGATLVALIGATGSGKSVILDSLYQRRPEGSVAIIPDEEPSS